MRASNTLQHIASRTHEPAPPDSVGKEFISARKLLDAAEAKATLLIDRARVEASELRARAAGEGYREGLQCALDKLLNVEALEGKLLNSAIQLMLSTCIEIAEEVIGETISQRNESIIARIKRAMAASHNLSDTRLVVHSETIARLAEELKSLSPMVCRIEADDSLSPESARLEASGCVFELDLNEHFQLVREHVLRSFRIHRAFADYLLAEVAQ